MKYSTLTLVSATLFLASCAMRGPTLSPEMEAVRSVSDTSTCEFIKSDYLESRPQVMQQYVKRNTHIAGGDSYKIVNTSQEFVMGAHISMVNYEVYRCIN